MHIYSSKIINQKELNYIISNKADFCGVARTEKDIMYSLAQHPKEMISYGQ